ncbi:MAG: glycosyltransferase, partial [Chthoniobacteraceae bacterium]
VEIQACGKPVLAFKGGGAIETVIEGETGWFFDETRTMLADAIRASEATRWNPVRIRANAEQFSEAAFHDRMGAIITRAAEAKREARDRERVGIGARIAQPIMEA